MAENDATYFALLKDEKLIDALRSRREQFIRYFRETSLFQRIQRSYRFYHNLYHEHKAYGENAIKVAGPEGEIRLVTANEYRSVIKLLVGYVISQRPEWDAMSHATDHEALESAKICNSWLDAYMADPEGHVEASLSQAVEDSLVLTAGYLWALWDAASGEEWDGDPERGTLEYTGDFKFLNPALTDVIYDTTVRDFSDSAYVLVRRKECKWDLVAQYPEVGAELAKLSIERELNSEGPKEDSMLSLLGLDPPQDEAADKVWVYYFYHKPTPAVPAGRFFRYVENIRLEDEGCRVIPLKRYVPAQYLHTCFGYSSMLDAQGPQEALNGVLSSLLTNQNALGMNKLWSKIGETINIADLEPGVKVLQTETKPESLNFLQSSPELLKAVELYTQIIERLSGVSAVSRGQTAPEVRSAAAAALMDSRTLQNASELIKNYRRFVCEVGTVMVKVFALKASTPRSVALIGENAQRFLRELKGAIFEQISRVSIHTGNPAMATPAGRASVAEFLATAGLIRTPQEFLTVVKTGNLDRFTEASEAQVRAAQAENDALLRGEPVDTFMLIDDHVLHLKKHAATFDTPDARKDAPTTKRAFAHMMQHVQALMDPKVQQLMVILGYQLPVPAGPGGPQQQEQKGTPPPPKPPQGRNPEVMARVGEAQANTQL